MRPPVPHFAALSIEAEAQRLHRYAKFLAGDPTGEEEGIVDIAVRIGTVVMKGGGIGHQLAALVAGAQNVEWPG